MEGWMKTWSARRESEEREHVTVGLRRSRAVFRENVSVLVGGGHNWERQAVESSRSLSPPSNTHNGTIDVLQRRAASVMEGGGRREEGWRGEGCRRDRGGWKGGAARSWEKKSCEDTRTHMHTLSGTDTSSFRPRSLPMIPAAGSDLFSGLECMCFFVCICE